MEEVVTGPCTVFRNFHHIFIIITYVVFVISDIRVAKMKVLDINGEGKPFSKLINYKIIQFINTIYI